MAGFSWSPEQQLAINEDNKNIIVSAGAGSGKTAVLSERVLRKIKDGVHVNELLILTFTNAAAAEMKERIRKKIIKEGYKEEANLIDGAYITTFDSFSLSMVKKYHARLNITNAPAITDEVVIDLQKKKILDEIMDEYYERKESNFLQLIKNYCLKKDDELKGYIEGIYKKIELKYDKTEYLNNFFKEEFTDEKINSFIKEYVDNLFSIINNLKGLLTDLNDYFDGEYITKVEDTILKLLNARTYEEIVDGLEFKSLPNLPKNSDEEGKKIKEVMTEMIKELKSLATYSSTTEMKEEILSTKQDAEVIVSILIELDKRLEEWKKDTESFNFNDIARLAIKVVKENDDIREELSKSFNEIMIDEYQDTSDTQETFIGLIAHNNVYMVGDIKQSIYRFRNANPYIFKNKYDSYRDTDAGMKIDLLANFRSRREVLANINTLFDLFMDDEIGGADYKASHRMNYGNKAYEQEGLTEQDYNYEFLMYDNSKESEYKKNAITKDEQEAFIIGQDILNKVNNNYIIFDKDDKIQRKVEYSDFVVLLDRSKNFELYKRIFEYLGIPMTILKEEKIGKDNDILVIKSLLKLLICIKNNDYKDEFRYAFTSVSRSFLYKTPDEEIFDCLKNNKFFESSLFIKCRELSKNIDIMDASEYFYYILEEFNYDEKLITTGNMKSMRVRNEYYYNLISNFEQSGNTIYDFVEYLEKIFEGSYDLKFNVNGESSNSCKIMTIHKSKGLEFPVCYFAGLSDKFNYLELKERIIYDNKYGLILPRVTKYYKDTILKTLLKLNTKKEEISERIRLLYVALTRAKEKMIFILPKTEEENYVSDIVPIYERKKYASFQDIIKSINGVLVENTHDVESNASKEYQERKEKTTTIPEIIDNLNVEEINIINEELEEKHFSKDIPHLVTKDERKNMNLGTKVHELLETTDFNNPNLDSYDVNDFIKNKINKFINSDLIKNNLNSNFYKEYEFTYIKDKEIKHGIIDLMIETDNKIIIVDYKFSNIDDPNYDKQVNGYMDYIKEISNKEVEGYLYSIMEEKFRKV